LRDVKTAVVRRHLWRRLAGLAAMRAGWASTAAWKALIRPRMANSQQLGARTFDSSRFTQQYCRHGILVIAVCS
jgi:hypothetical protein